MAPGHHPSVEIRLQGQKIVLKAPADEELVQEVVALATRLLATAEKRIPGKNPPGQHVALLALLDLAEEYVLAKRRVAELQRDFGAKTDELRNLILQAEVVTPESETENS